MADGSLDFDWTHAQQRLAEAAHGADDAELFLECSRSESFLWDDGRMKSATYDSTQGFGLRVVAGETAGYAHASALDDGSIDRAAEAAAAAKR
ncbi:MAG: metalloprotease TldD, partial [Alphaproteobacteria bacterium]|nr:metalloprotease TldD [Alphaproteobacteria bacterium]